MTEFILTEDDKKNIHVFEPAGRPPMGGFTWAYWVEVYGRRYRGIKRHPTRRAAWQAAKSFYKATCRHLRQEQKISANQNSEAEQ